MCGVDYNAILSETKVMEECAELIKTIQVLDDIEAADLFQ